MSSVPMSNGGPPPPAGWYPPPYNHSGYHSQPQYHTNQQHPGMYGGHHHQPPPQAVPPPNHPQQYPSHHQQSYQQYPGNPSGYPPSSSRGIAQASAGGSYPPAQYGEPHYGGMAANPASSYPYHHQAPYSYQHQHYGYHQQLHMHEDSGEKSVSSDHRPTPTSEVEYHHHHQHHLESMMPPHTTPRSDSQQMGQYGHYGPPSGVPSANSHSMHAHYSNQNQQPQVHTPSYPSSQGANHPGQHNSSAWMNYSAGTPSVPTPQTAPTPSSSAPSIHGYSNTGSQGSTPSSGSNQTNHQSFYSGNQQYQTAQNTGAASFPAPPPFPYQQRPSFPVPPPPAQTAIPPPQFDPPAARIGNDFDPPGNYNKGVSSRSSAQFYEKSKDKALEGTRRRFSFGSQITTKLSNCSNTSPPQHDERLESDSESIPAPPGSARDAQMALSKHRASLSDTYEHGANGGALKESRRQNSLNSKFEANAAVGTLQPAAPKSDTKSPTANFPSTARKPKINPEENAANSKTPSFDDASLLLGLRTHSNTNSPETVPATVSHDSNEENEQRKWLKLAVNIDKKADQQKDAKDANIAVGKAPQAKTGNETSRMQIDDPSLPAFVPAPGTNNMVPLDYPKRLVLPNDAVKLNSLHCLIRAELLEIFVIEPSSLKNTKHLYAPSSSVGRVGLRCVHCAMARRRFQDEFPSVAKEQKVDESRQSRDDTGSSDLTKEVSQSVGPRMDVSDGAHIARDDEAPMAVFYPKSIAEIYRLVTSWQRCHLRKCRNVPPPVRSDWNERRETDKTRGKTTYWISSAKEIGLVDCTSRAGGIRFRIRATEDASDGKIKQEENNTSNGSEIVIDRASEHKVDSV